MSRRKERKEQLERLERARAELEELQCGLRRAYLQFDAVTDPALTEAAILEIGALQQRYGRSFRALKALCGA